MSQHVLLLLLFLLYNTSKAVSESEKSGFLIGFMVKKKHNNSDIFHGLVNKNLKGKNDFDLKISLKRQIYQKYNTVM